MSPEASRTESTFQLTYTVAASIPASPAAVWARLTSAREMPAWNSTVTSVEGDIARGKRLAIRVPIAPGRVFRPRVDELEPERRMVWRDGFAPMFRGERVFTVEAEGGGTRFTMTETFTGLMLPMIKRSLPDFRPVFAQYAADLVRACA